METLNLDGEESNFFPTDNERSPLARFKSEALKYQHTISAASRLIRRKITQSGHLMMSKKFWMQTVPNQDVDVVITFPPDSCESTVLWFKERIERIPGIILRIKSVTLARGTKTRPNCYGFLISASYQGYLQGLEQLQVPKPLKSDYGGGTKEFTIKESSHFRGIESLNEFLTSQERQAVIYHLLSCLRAEKGDRVAEKISFLEGEAIIPHSLSARVIYQVFPVHEPALLEQLRQTWVKKIWEPQPIGSICDYFGVKIAMYFAWLGHYTTALCIPAIVGIFFWFFFCGRADFLDDLGFVIFGFFNVIWATLYLESWKRRSSELAYEWGTADQRTELLSEPRPLFRGEESISEITGKPERIYPEWKRNVFRYFVTVPVISVCLFVVFVSVFLILELQQWWDSVIVRKSYFSFLSYLPKIFLACVIPALDSVYSKIAVWLNDMENYRNAARYENNRVIKIALFQFVNSFLALFYTAFYLQDMEKLKELLAALLITRQVMGNIKESLIPYVKQQLRFAKISFDLYGAVVPNSPTTTTTSDDNLDASVEGNKKEDSPNETDQNETERKLSQVEMESSRPAYEGTFDDYLEMFIQFGYVTLFSSAYPLAGMFALLNNLIEIRGDAFKLCHIHQRPFGQRVNNIGSWQTAMEMMGTVGVIVNCALIGLSGQVNRMFPNITPTQTILLIIVLEHFMLMLKLLISYAIPDIPSWVATEMAKIEYHRREIEKEASLALVHSGTLAPSIASSIETVDKSIQTEEPEDDEMDDTLAPFEEEDEMISLTIETTPEQTIHQIHSSQNVLEKMNSLSSLSSVDTDRFKAAVVNSSAKNVFEKQQRESPRSYSAQSSQNDIYATEQEDTIRKRSLPEHHSSSPVDRPIPSSSTSRREFDGHTKMLYQRMASDTDLWLGLKARQAKYKSIFSTTKELSPVEDERSYVTQDGDKPDSKSTPVRKGHDLEDLEKRLKAKRAVFKTKGRSLSLASFRLLPSSSKKHKQIAEHSNGSKSNGKHETGLTHKESKDERYLKEYRAQGELEILDLESLINVNDVRKRLSK